MALGLSRLHANEICGAMRASGDGRTGPVKAFLIGLAAALLAGGGVAGCGDDAAEQGRARESVAERAAAAQLQADRAAARRERAAERAAAARRKAREAAADRAARARARGDALLKVFVDAGTRDRWSVMSVSTKGGDVTVHTDLPPGDAAAFTGACAALADHESWIDSVAVVGTDGAPHAWWHRGEASCGS